MKTLAEFQTLALAKVRAPDFSTRLARLFDRFDLAEARDIISTSNRLRGSRDAIQEKGAVGEAVVASAMRHYFGHLDGRGWFEIQYEYWGSHGIDETYPMRTMDILFLRPTKRVERGSVTFQVEAKNHQDATVTSLRNGNLQKQITKDTGYLNPKIEGHAPVIPVWWFLQGLTPAARNYLEARDFRVVDFNSNPFDAEIQRAFRVV